jgi:hypothetical protein
LGLERRQCFQALSCWLFEHFVSASQLADCGNCGVLRPTTNREVKAVIRRSEKPDSRIFRFGDAEVDFDRCEFRRGEDRLELTAHVSQFGDQTEAAKEARKRLAELPKPQEQSAGGVVGWYNGDWQSGIPGLANWYVSKDESARVYDDFVVPEGGWTVVGVFSNSRMNISEVTGASWGDPQRSVGRKRRSGGGFGPEPSHADSRPVPRQCGRNHPRQRRRQSARERRRGVLHQHSGGFVLPSC